LGLESPDVLGKVEPGGKQIYLRLVFAGIAFSSLFFPCQNSASCWGWDFTWLAAAMVYFFSSRFRMK
jgi:hypothetical protein